MTGSAVMAAVEQLPPVAVALARVAAEVGAVGKGDRHTQQGFMYRGLDAVLNAVGPVLHRHRVVVVPEVLASTFDAVEVGAKKTMMFRCVLTVRYRFVGPAGDHLDATVIGEALDVAGGAAVKAQSVALRVALIQTLSLPTHEPDPVPESDARSTPIMAVINLARAAGLEGEALAADVAARHDGKALAELREAELRGEWRHWKALATSKNGNDL